ncbi:TPR-like protein [Annulohypoxylon maeteangense]|uniref:TPR-like protein n=1 Tax=Annulohypoxylon maeteangense TaxID=1927788 RepID=UPI002008C6CA|nr:TPR-like protein [Annulohypoxylon maeteangense]KAI0881909.1 TPR-like protein [Annulohypoxylon maeteangense]
MSHPFSSTFDALQAHFTQKPDKPDVTPLPPTQTQKPVLVNNDLGTTESPRQNADLSHISSARTPLPVATSNLLLPRPGQRVLLPKPNSASVQPTLAQGLQNIPRNGTSTLPQAPPGHAISWESYTQPILPRTQGPALTPMGPSAGPSVSHNPSGTLHSSEASSQISGARFNELSINEASTAGATEDQANPIDTSTDALLERQNELNSENPLPKLPPPVRGFAKKILNLENKPQRPRGGRQNVRKRGPRKAAEPTGDIKYRLNMASNAYMDGRIDEAIDYVHDAIRINAETYRAWVLLASFLQEKGDQLGHYRAKWFATNLQPQIIDGWLQCAELAIGLRDEFPEDEGLTDEAILSYSQALKIENSHRPARHGRAALSLEMGHLRKAVGDYTALLGSCVFDIYALRGLAEGCVLLADTGKSRWLDQPGIAIDAYRRCISHFRENGLDIRYPFDWQDIKIFVELLAYVKQFNNAIHELRSLSRWLLTRSDEVFWDSQNDDREWDVDNSRRLELEQFQEKKYPASSYGKGLPLEMRTKLAAYRLKLGQEDEAMHHLEFIDPDQSNGPEILSECPHLLLEGASALYEAGRLQMALRFYEPLREPDLLDTESLVRAGRCYLNMGDKRQAEECFTAAIDQDEINSEACIDARYELAKMYEAAREEKEAFILVNEAIRLQEVRDQAREEALEEERLGDDNDDDQGDGDLALPEHPLVPATRKEAVPKPKRAKRPPKPKVEKVKPAPKERKPKASPKPASRRRKVFARTEELQLEEKKRASELAETWKTVHECRASSKTDAKGPSSAFMSAAGELVDDFRSYKEFYTWDKYLAHLNIHQAREKVEAQKGNPNLIAMAQRLSHNLNPENSEGENQTERVAVSYRGVPFNEWLDLFLEYAMGLAQTGRYQDAYKVCESARDTTIFSKSKEDMFLIHVAWAACALRGRDEETCVASARWIMREYQYDTEPFRMFSALSRLCPSPASWYASGPVQKYMLRQIKLMDRAINAAGAEVSGDEDGPPTGRVFPGKELDVTLLMLYGNILFISNSFTYALNYFMRAHSLDPYNTMVILSVGNCYVYYALKRQAENRQYLLTQGFHFLHQYYELKLASPDTAQRQEAHYNLARSYHAVGIPHLATEYYRRALREVPDDSGNGVMGRNDLSREAAYNMAQICWAGGDVDAVKAVTDQYLVI